MIGRRVGAGSSVLGVALAVMLATGALAASPYQAVVLEDVCTDSGGQHGRGYIKLKVKAREVGASGTNYFKIKSRLEWSSGIAWSTRSTWPVEVSTTFPNNATNYYRNVTRRYDFRPNDDVSHRIWMKVEFWSSTDGLITSKTRVSTC